MSAARTLGLTHPSILDSLAHLYQTECFHENARMREALADEESKTRQMRQEIEYLQETCRLYATVLCSLAHRRDHS